MKISGFEVEKIKELHSRNQPVAQICRSLGIKKGVVEGVIRKCKAPPTPHIYTAQSKKINIKTIQQSAEFICKILSELRSDKIDNKSASTQTYILSILIRALSESELEKRIKAVEEKICRKEKVG